MQRILLILFIFFSVFGFFNPASLQSSLLGGAENEDPDAWEEYWNKLQPPDKVMDTIGIKPGMIVGEIGAGRGRYVVKVAERVGPKGMVYANDIDPEALEYLEFRKKRDNISNVVTILGTVTDPRLPAGELDFIYFINTYHHIEKPIELLKNAIPALKSTGRLVIIEHDPEKPSPRRHNTPKEAVLEHARAAGYELIKIETYLEFDNIYIFRVKSEIVRPAGRKDDPNPAE